MRSGLLGFVGNVSHWPLCSSPPSSFPPPSSSSPPSSSLLPPPHHLPPLPSSLLLISSLLFPPPSSPFVPHLPSLTAPPSPFSLSPSQGGLVFICGTLDGLIQITSRRHNTEDLIATVMAVEPHSFIYKGRWVYHTSHTHHISHHHTITVTSIKCFT